MTEHEAIIWWEETQAQHILTLTACRDLAALYLGTSTGEHYRVTTTVRADMRLIDLVTQMQRKLAEVTA